MKLNLKIQNLTGQLEKDYKLLGQLEDSRRLTSDPQDKANIEYRIGVLKEEIGLRLQELETPQVYSKSIFSGENLAVQEVKTEPLMITGTGYASLTNFQNPNSIITRDYFDYPIPKLDSDFFGRTEILEEINKTKETIHFIVIVGITGIGKTALLKKLIVTLNEELVFWHKFRSGFVTLEDVLMRLARFLDKRNKIVFFETALQITNYSIQDKINLIFQGLNSTESHLFFDDFHLIEENTQLNSFFEFLKEHLNKGCVFLSTNSQPRAVKPQDIVQKYVKLIHLEGLSDDETEELLSKKGITISREGVKKLKDYLDGMPLAINLLINLAEKDVSEENLIKLAENVQGQIIEYLYDALYEKLKDSEKKLLSLVSLLKLPFTKDVLIKFYVKQFNENAASAFFSLRRKSLIIDISGGFFKVPDIVRELAYTHTHLKLEEISNKFAEYLLEVEPEDYYAHLEACFLFREAKNWNSLADILSELIDRHMAIYDPELAEKLLEKLKEENFGAERWMWILGNKGTIATYLRQYEKAETIYLLMLDLSRKLDNKDGESLALQRLGSNCIETDNYIEAEKCCLESLKLKVELSDFNGQAEIHNNLGLIYSSKGDFELALIEFEKGLDLRCKAEHPEWEFLPLYSNLGILNARIKNWSKAFEYSHKALKIAKELNSPYDIAKSLYNLAKHNLELEEFDLSEKDLLEVLDISEEYDLDEVKELAFIGLGGLYHRTNKYEKAVFYFEQVAEICEKYSQKNTLCGIKFDIGTFHLSNKDLEKATEFYLEGIDLFENLKEENERKLYLNNILVLALQVNSEVTQNLILSGLKKIKRQLCAETNSDDLAYLYGIIGDIYLNSLKKEKVAIACFRQEIKLLQQLNHQKKAVNCLISLAGHYENTEFYGKSLKTLEEAERIAKQENFSDLTSTFQYNTANVFSKVEKYVKAVSYYKKAEKTALKENNLALVDMIRHNLGETYRRKGELENAFNLLKITLISAREKNNIIDIIFVLNSIGLACEELEKETESLTYFHEAVRLAHSNNLYHEETNTLLSIGNFYWLREDYLQAKSYYEQALKIAQENGDIEMEEGAMLGLAESHRKLGTVAEIEKEFQRIAERADELKNYENLCKFSTIAGSVNLEEGKAEEAAEMYEQALILVYWRIVVFVSQLAPDQKNLINTLEFSFVLSRLGFSIKYVIEKGEVEVVKRMFELLMKRLENKTSWGNNNLIKDTVKSFIETLLED